MFVLLGIVLAVAVALVAWRLATKRCELCGSRMPWRREVCKVCGRWVDGHDPSSR